MGNEEVCIVCIGVEDSPQHKLPDVQPPVEGCEHGWGERVLDVPLALDHVREWKGAMGVGCEGQWTDKTVLALIETIEYLYARVHPTAQWADVEALVGQWEAKAADLRQQAKVLRLMPDEQSAALAETAFSYVSDCAAELRKALGLERAKGEQG